MKATVWWPFDDQISVNLLYHSLVRLSIRLESAKIDNILLSLCSTRRVQAIDHIVEEKPDLLVWLVLLLRVVYLTITIPSHFVCVVRFRSITDVPICAKPLSQEVRGACFNLECHDHELKELLSLFFCTLSTLVFCPLLESAVELNDLLTPLNVRDIFRVSQSIELVAFQVCNLFVFEKDLD